MTTTKTRTITLSNRAPVSIHEDKWPEIAIGDCRPGAMRNGTPVPHYETDRYTIRVRQHADGRAIVYGVVDASTPWNGTKDWKGGELLTAGDDIPAAIRRVCAAGQMPSGVADECTAALPAEEI